MSLENSTPALRRRLWWAGGLLALLAAAVVVAGLVARRSQAAGLRERADALAVPTVKVIAPAAAASAARLELPARIEAWSRAPLYARVSGYLKAWHADIGTPVKAGQLLAEIETPDLDQQLSQAQAELSTAKANAALAATTAKRWQSLLSSDSVSRQEAEEKAGDLAAKQSVVNALQANVERVQALKKFTRIVAPFDGVVTSRSTDLGALISVGGAPGTELFVVSDTRRLRVYANVPQNDVAWVRQGMVARLTVPERPGQSFAAKVLATSQAINSASGSMLVQLSVENARGELIPGGFASVAFELPRGAGAFTVPPSALIFDKAGLRVATVDAVGVVALKPVTVSRDLGASIEIGNGLAAGDRVIESPPDGLDNGDKVQVAAPPAAPATPSATPSAAPSATPSASGQR